ncbi:hypothetical protein EKK58_02375 [Candidatus Dependentiae bacterium]|nr:MAG: hypothetical protein EKK58_02375 [Candidatus Dependentiae bacterium]
MNQNQQKNNTDNIFCASEKQISWCIFLAIALLCIAMLLSYIVGYKTAIRNIIIEDSKKNSFSDQIYASLAHETLSLEDPADQNRFYLQCTINKTKDLSAIMALGKKYGVTFSLVEDEKSKNAYCQYMISSIINTYKDADDLGKLLQNNGNLIKYDIVSLQNNLHNIENERPCS